MKNYDTNQTSIRGAKARNGGRERASARILRAGIDSLYLSFSGRLDSTRDKELATKKLTAQSSEEVKRASA